MNVAVLCGGKGRRVGMDKGFLSLNGTRFAEIMMRKFEGCDVVFVCRDERQAEVYRREFGCETTVDTVKNFSPLAGIHSALKYFEDYTLVVAIDMPLVKRGLAEFIYDNSFGYHALIPTWSDGKLEPLLSCYSPKSIGEIERCIRTGIRKVSKPFESLKTLYFPVDFLRVFDERLISFTNVNTLEDLEMVRCLWTGSEDL